MGRDKRTARGHDEPQAQEEMTVVVMKNLKAAVNRCKKGLRPYPKRCPRSGRQITTLLYSDCLNSCHPPMARPSMPKQSLWPRSLRAGSLRAGRKFPGPVIAKERGLSPRQSTRLWVTLTCRPTACHR